MVEGAFLAAIDPGTQQIAGCIYVNVTERSGYFGMLAVAAIAQGRWLGLRLIQAAERQVRDEGALTIEIEVVNLRAELFPYYHRLGYEETGETRPYVHRPVTRTCHFVVLRKRLAGHD
jgi:GNAT superfamily N-acetyltransferase